MRKRGKWRKGDGRERRVSSKVKIRRGRSERKGERRERGRWRGSRER